MQAGHSWEATACRHLSNSIMVTHTATHLAVNSAGQQQSFMQNAAVDALEKKQSVQ